METNTRIGVAYRPELRVELFRAPATIDYLEITAEHFLDLRGRVRDDLDALKATFPIVVHALGLSIGSADGVDPGYLERLAKLIAYVEAPWWSDHLGFTHAAGIEIGFFVPLRRDEAAIEIVARNAERVRKTIVTPFALENLALPFVVPGSRMSEAAFLTRTADAAGCRLLLDVENLHANERNWSEPADAAIVDIPTRLIAEVHVAGGRQGAQRYIDSHDAAVSDRTWSLLDVAAGRGTLPAVTLERDANLSSLAALESELQQARRITLGRAA